MGTVVLIGGNGKKTTGRLAKYNGLENVLFYCIDDKAGKKPKRVMEPRIKRSDCVVVITGACSHRNMWDAKELAKKYEKPIIYSSSRGATSVAGSIKLVLQSRTA